MPGLPPPDWRGVADGVLEHDGPLDGPPRMPSGLLDGRLGGDDLGEALGGVQEVAFVIVL